MEDLCQIFPLVSQIVLNNLDDQSLANCKIASKALKEFLENEKFFSIRIIKKYKKNFELFLNSWKKVIHNTPKEVVKEFAGAIQKFFKAGNITNEEIRQLNSFGIALKQVFVQNMVILFDLKRQVLGASKLEACEVFGMPVD